MTNTAHHDVVIIGSLRTPFARGNTAYVDFGTRDLLTAAMKALVDKFDLRGEQLGAVASGAVMKCCWAARVWTAIATSGGILLQVRKNS